MAACSPVARQRNRQGVERSFTISKNDSAWLAKEQQLALAVMPLSFALAGIAMPIAPRFVHNWAATCKICAHVPARYSSDHRMALYAQASAGAGWALALFADETGDWERTSCPHRIARRLDKEMGID